MMSEIINKVASSGLVSIDLEQYIPREDIVVFDLRDHLFMELILKEKDFRETLKSMDWSRYSNSLTAITCSADAVIPLWAYMLVASYLTGVAKEVYTGTKDEMIKHLTLKNINAIDAASFTDQRIVVKGCGDKTIENYAYAEVTKVLKPYVKSIMYGEPCSTVPVFKKK